MTMTMTITNNLQLQIKLQPQLKVKLPTYNFFSVLFAKPDDKLMRIAKIAIALHCSGHLVEYAIVSHFSLPSQKYHGIYTIVSHVSPSNLAYYQMVWTGKLIVYAGHWATFFGDHYIEHLLTPFTFIRW